MIKNSIVRVLAYDPALTKCGWSHIEYDINTGMNNVVKHGEIVGKTVLKNRKGLIGIFENSYLILCEIEDIVSQMIKDFKPDYIVVENAFSHRFPKAYASLVLVINAIRDAAFKTHGKDIFLIAPRESKCSVSGNGTSDKVAIQNAVLNHPNISIKDTKQQPLTSLSEHSADSIASGYTFTTNYLPTLLL